MLFTVSGSVALRFPHWAELYHLADISEFPFFSIFRTEIGLIWADVSAHVCMGKGADAWIGRTLQATINSDKLRC
jgi:hypothetical protein